MIGLGVGVRSDAYRIRGVIRHEQSGLLVDPDQGVIYGRAGEPIGSVCGDGYVRLGGRRRGMSCLYAHRVIWEAVHGEIPAGLEIDHLNGRKADNRISNLDAVTHSENVLRAVAMGLAPIGESRSDSKLTEQIVLRIRESAGERSVGSWARELGVDRTTIRQARDGTTWRHVPLRIRSSDARRRSRRRKSANPLPPEAG